MADALFSMSEISDAIGLLPCGVGGISYGASELWIPLSEGRYMMLREGDDCEGDHKVAVYSSPPNKCCKTWDEFFTGDRKVIVR